ERRVLEAEPSAARAQTARRPLGRAAAALLMLAVPTAAILGYRSLGGGAAAIAQETAAVSTPASPHAGADMQTTEVPPVDQLTERLAQRLKNDPDDADGWLLLARSYHHLGRRADAQSAYAQAQAHGGEDGDLAALIAAPAADDTAIPPNGTGTALADLKARAEAHPEDGDAWLALAQSYRSQRDFTAASGAYAKAQSLLPPDADLLADYADAMAAAQDRRLDGEPTVLVEQALQIDPDHPKALWLAATAALQRGDNAQAKTHWLHLQRLLPDDSPDRRIIDRNLATLDGASTDTPVSVDNGGAPAVVRGRVDISPELRARVSDDDTVFIFARAADGPPMPLAVLRIQVRDLPFEFSLDDSLAMQPQLKLSAFEQVMLGARVSRTGTVTQQPGEPRGDLGPVPTRGGAEQRLLIDQAGS
ncbi:MAG TPA: hypothetical protein VIR60_02725, partial [Gammaproteobacteria bacterium]